MAPDDADHISTSIIGLAATSLATANVSAFSLNLMAKHMSGGSTWIDAPGNLYAMLLLMGDRQSTSGKAVKKSDHRWGVGRLRGRLMGENLDSPYYWYHGTTCIADGEVWDFQIGGGDMPADVEAVKAAAYWYDRRHESSGAVANINLSLRNGTTHIDRDLDSSDNKAVVFVDDWAAEPLYIRLIGENVANHHDYSCSGSFPNDRIRVHFAIFAEDSDRESPTYNASTGEGIAPEDI